MGWVTPAWLKNGFTRRRRNRLRRVYHAAHSILLKSKAWLTASTDTRSPPRSAGSLHRFPRPAQTAAGANGGGKCGRDFRRSADERSAAFGTDRQGNFAVLTAATASVMALASASASTSRSFTTSSRACATRSTPLSPRQRATSPPARSIPRMRAPDSRHSSIRQWRSRVRRFRNRLVLDKLVVDQTAKTVTATAHVDADLFFPLFGGGLDQASRPKSPPRSIRTSRSRWR